MAGGPLVNSQSYEICGHFLRSKSTISMAIFNSYVGLPEGIIYDHCSCHAYIINTYEWVFRYIYSPIWIDLEWILNGEYQWPKSVVSMVATWGTQTNNFTQNDSCIDAFLSVNEIQWSPLPIWYKLVPIFFVNTIKYGYIPPTNSINCRISGQNTPAILHDVHSRGLFHGQNPRGSAHWSAETQLSPGSSADLETASAEVLTLLFWEWSTGYNGYNWSRTVLSLDFASLGLVHPVSVRRLIPLHLRSCCGRIIQVRCGPRS